MASGGTEPFTHADLELLSWGVAQVTRMDRELRAWRYWYDARERLRADLLTGRVL